MYVKSCRIYTINNMVFKGARPSAGLQLWLLKSMGLRLLRRACASEGARKCRQAIHGFRVPRLREGPLSGFSNFRSDMRRMAEILHDLIYGNSRNSGSIVYIYIRSYRMYIMNSEVLQWTPFPKQGKVGRSRCRRLLNPVSDRELPSRRRLRSLYGTGRSPHSSPTSEIYYCSSDMTWSIVFSLVTGTAS